MTIWVPPGPNSPPAETAHQLVVKVAFEVIGIGLLALLADSNETAGSIIITLMVAFLFLWLITKGGSYIATFNKGLRG